MGSAYRLCWSEADGLPGLVVDRYGPVSVVQCLTLGMARVADWVREALERLFPGDPMLRLDDPTAARIEGFEPVRETYPTELVVEEGPARFAVALGSGHKTGFYLDQRDNRKLFADTVRHFGYQRVLNCYCYTGGFSVAALAGGAGHVTSVDSSAPALARADAHVALNGFDAARHTSVDADVNQTLRASLEQGASFDAIVLDPPKFAPTASHAERAARAYKDINRLALKLLEPGGALFTFSCSGGISADLFHKIVAGAGLDAGADGLIYA
ncbi:MAG TPA: class I SAM-dependent rRNA methyltransferase, partial [Methylomirabilota bacterium]|nr:class I SAM-dependent rRNA methyltransferase [Methylomirabilota bacterium]